MPLSRTALSFSKYLHKTSFAAAFAVCFSALAAGAQAIVNIHDIMTALPNSPYLGQSVSVSGIVVGVMSTGGFYITQPVSTWDNNTATAEGMPVFAAAGANPSCAVVGNAVTVVGTVSNTTIVNGADTPGTGITPTSCTVTGTGTVTQAITLPTNPTTYGAYYQYTGMPVSNGTLSAISPTGGTLDEVNELVTSNGQFWADLVQPNNGHLFRTAGIALDEFVPPVPNAATIPRWSGNPQRVYIDTTTFGGLPMDIGAGQQLVCTVPPGLALGASAGIGVIDYTLGYARLLIFQSTVCTVTGSITPAVSAPADAQHFHVGSLDLGRFYSTTGATAGSVAITPAAYARQRAKAAMAIVNYIGHPDILGLENVQDLQTLTDIASDVNTTAGTNYVPYLDQGNDPAGLSIGFLVNTNTVVVDSVTQIGLNSTYTTVAGATVPLWEHPPQVLIAEVKRAGLNYSLTVIHQDPTPRTNSGDPVLGPDIRGKRAMQAGILSQLVQQHESAGENLLVAGNFNEYSFNDGYVDLVDTIVGNQSAASAVANFVATSTTQPLYNFEGSVANGTKYNIIEFGNARSIEHMLVSQVNTGTTLQPLSTYATTITQSHFTTDFPADMENSATTPAGFTPHDGFVAAFLIPPVPTFAGISISNVDFGNVNLGQSAQQTVTVTNTSTQQSNLNITGIAISGANGADFTETTNCTTLAEGASCNIVVTFAPTAVGVRNGTLTVSTDSTNNPTLTASLTGTGLPTTATIGPNSANFGSVYLTATSAAQTFTITNTSDINLTFAYPAISGDFAIVSTTCGSAAGSTTLAPGASCTVTVTFSPTAPGTRTGTLSVANSSSADNPLTAALTGTGLATTATLTPAALNFGSVIVGTTAPAQTLTFANTSGVVLNITSIAATGDFSVANTSCAGSLAANSTCVINVAFAPTLPGARIGTLSIVSSSSANGTLTASLSGTGVADVTTSVGTLPFGNEDVTIPSAAQSITVTNNTGASIAITSITVQGDYAFTSACGSAIAGKSSCSISVVFTPTALGARPGTLTINTSDKSTPVLTVDLTGNGVDFAIATTSATGNVIAGDGFIVPATVTPLSGFSAPVTFSCTTNAGGSTCIPNPAILTLSKTTTVGFYIQTTSQYTVIGYGGFGEKSWLLLLTLLSAAAIYLRRSKAKLGRRFAALAALLVAVVMTAGGCSGRLPDRNANPTYPGTYQYTFIATDGHLTHTATYSLAVRVK